MKKLFLLLVCVFSVSWQSIKSMKRLLKNENLEIMELHGRTASNPIWIEFFDKNIGKLSLKEDSRDFLYCEISKADGLDELKTYLRDHLELKNLGIRLSEGIAFTDNFFENLTHIEFLSIKKNKLSKIPESISNLNNLVFLDVSENKLTRINVKLPASLQQLAIVNNNLKKLSTRTLPGGLQVLLLAGNEIKELPSYITNLTSLTWLSLTKNKLSLLPYDIGNLVNLESLSLAENQIVGLPCSIGKLIKLKSFTIKDNNLTFIPEVVLNLTNLDRIDFSNNYIDPWPRELVEKGIDADLPPGFLGFGVQKLASSQPVSFLKKIGNKINLAFGSIFSRKA
jgi:hypothetical protein